MMRHAAATLDLPNRQLGEELVCTTPARDDTIPNDTTCECMHNVAN